MAGGDTSAAFYGGSSRALKLFDGKAPIFSCKKEKSRVGTSSFAVLPNFYNNRRSLVLAVFEALNDPLIWFVFGRTNFTIRGSFFKKAWRFLDITFITFENGLFHRSRTVPMLPNSIPIHVPTLLLYF